MTHATSGIDLHIVMHNKRKMLVSQVDGLFHEFKNMIHTSQIHTESLTEKLTEISQRIEVHLSELMSVEDLISKQTLVCEETQSGMLAHNLEILREINDRLLISRVDRFKDNDQHMRSSLSDVAAESVSYGSDAIIISKKEEISTILGEKSSSRAETLKPDANEPSKPIHEVGRNALQRNIQSQNMQLAKLHHSIYELTTSLDETSADNSSKNLRDDKASALTELRRLRSQVHAKTVAKEGKARLLAYRAVECRNKLRQAMIYLSRVNSLSDMYISASKSN